MQERNDNIDLNELAGTLKRQSLLAGLLSFVGIGAVLGALLWSYFHLRDATSQLNNLNAQIQSRQQELANLQSQVNDLQLKKQAYSNVLNGVLTSTPKGGQQVLEAALKADPSAAPLITRIYLQIADKSQRPFAEQIASGLRARGFTVPGIEYVGPAKSPNQTQLRCFYQEDKSSKNWTTVQNTLVQLGVHAVGQLISLPPSAHKPQPGQYELWFALDFKPTQSSTASGSSASPGV